MTSEKIIIIFISLFVLFSLFAPIAFAQTSTIEPTSVINWLTGLFGFNPPSKASCGSEVNTCINGNFIDVTDLTNQDHLIVQYKWKCKGLTSSTAVSCAKYAPVHGICGTAARSYNYSESSLQGTFCKRGNPSPTTPIMNTTPVTNRDATNTTWVCLGSYGGSNTTCIASRMNGPTVNAVCGTAARDYNLFENSLTGTICASGKPNIANPILTADRNSVTWLCLGSYGGTHTSCTALRITGPPVNGVCGTAARDYNYHEYSLTGTFCTLGTPNPVYPSLNYTIGDPTTWLCLGSNGGTATNCSAVRNGICGTTMNYCGEGILRDLADSSTQYKWNCVSSTGGVFASCTLNKPIDGVCGTRLNTCNKGYFIDKEDTPEYSAWTCSASNGGSSADCQLLTPINGVCSTTTKDTCISGTFSDKGDSSTQYKWICNGINKGKNASCVLKR